MHLHHKLGGGLATVAVIALVVTTLLAAQQPPPNATPAPPQKPAETPAPPQPTIILPMQNGSEPGKVDKAVSFEMRDRPWKSVFEWLSNETGLPVITTAVPTGTFSYYGHSKKKYSIPEVIDVINEALLNQKFIMIRRDASFTVIPADQQIDPAILPRVKAEDLANRGSTEIVAIVVDLKSLVAEDVGPEIKKMMGPFGEYTALTRSNQLVLQDTVKTLRRIIDTIEVMERSEKNGQYESFSHKCEYIKARDAEKILKELLGDVAALIKQITSATQPQGQGGQRGGGDGKAAAQPPTMQLPKIRPFYITADERTNTVLVSGPPDKIAQAREIMKRIDVPQKGQQPIALGPPVLKTYSTATGSADVVAKQLQEIFKSSTSVRISAVGTSSVMVLAGPEDQFEIARLIQGADTRTNATELISLGTLDADKLAVTLKGMFVDPKTNSGPYIEADTSRNAIIVKGTAEQVADVKLTIKAIGEGESAGGNVRIITLDRGGGAAAVAAELERLMSQMRNNPVRVVTPSSSATEEQPPAKVPGKGGPRDEQPLPTEPRVNRTGGGKPVTITAVGNKLIITSEDPDALKLAHELARLLTSTTVEGDFEIIRLKNANATDAARVIDEAFNGTKQQTTTGGGGGFGFPFGGGRFGGGAATPAATATAARVRVVADPSSNALLVKASPADMLSIRRLLKDAIDSGDDTRTLTRTFVIGPLKYSKATNVADVIRDVYRDSMNSNTTQSGGSQRVPFFLGGGQQGNQRITDAAGNPRPAALTVSTEEQTNSIIVHCSDTLYRDISKLVEALEGTAKGSPRSVQIVPIKGIDPEVLQRAIDALHPNAANQPNNIQGGFRGFQGGNNRGQGGGNRGGGGRTSRNRAPEREAGGGSENFERGAKDGHEPAIMDDGHKSILFDPAPAIQPVAYLQQPELPPRQPQNDARGPIGNVNIEALREIGALIISAENKEDLEEVLRIVKIIQESARDAEIEFQLVSLKHGDATHVVSVLNTLFSKVVVSSNGNVSIPLADQAKTATQRGQFGNNSFVQQTDAPSSVVLVPLPRFNGILVGSPRARTKDVLREIDRLDQPNAPNAGTTPFALKKAPASRVAALITNFYATRYNENTDQNQIRITADDASNTVFVQAAPADLAEIRDLIERIDSSVSSAINDVRIIRLRNALSEELASTILSSITQGVVAPTAAAAPGIVPRPGAAPGGAAAPGSRAGGAAAPGPVIGPTGVSTKMTTLRFYSQPGGSVESGLLEDVHITSEPRSNSLIVSAPPRTMDLIYALVRELDVVSTARAEMKIFTMKKADAQATAVLLQQLFLGGAAAAARPGGAAGAAGLAGPTAAGSTASGSRPLLSLSGQPADGATLIDLKISVDDRTNSLIIAGSRNDLEVIEAVISRLEDADVQARRNEVYRLRNATAADVANSVQQFLTSTITVLRNAQQLTAFQEIQRDVVLVPEPISNSLLISATPRYYDELMRIVAQLDEMPPQVVIQVLVAQVSLTGNEEFGVEVGLQSPVLFQRSIIPGQTTMTGSTSGIPLPTGVTVNSSISQTTLTPGGTVSNQQLLLPGFANPGFNFNQPAVFPQTNFGADPRVVGFQGLGNLGVGRISPTSGIGGLVFSAASDTFTLLIRALKLQGRIDVLSRPQVMTLDNQTAAINIGQEIPIVTNTVVTANGLAQNNIDRRNVGILLKVTPRITPDGKVLMRVFPEVSSVVPTPVQLGNGQLGTALNVQQVETTVAAPDGETVVIGGMITTSDTKNENKIPWLGDLPYVGSMFRYRTQSRSKQELIVILTPHIVRSQADADRIMLEESRRMDWILGDACKIHGTNNMRNVLPDAPCATSSPVPMLTPPLEPDAPPMSLPTPNTLPPTPPEPALDQSKAKSKLPTWIRPTSHEDSSKDTKKPAAKDAKQEKKTQEEKPWVFRKDF